MDLADPQQRQAVTAMLEATTELLVLMSLLLQPTTGGAAAANGAASGGAVTAAAGPIARLVKGGSPNGSRGTSSKTGSDNDRYMEAYARLAASHIADVIRLEEMLVALAVGGQRIGLSALVEAYAAMAVVNIRAAREGKEGAGDRSHCRI